MEVVLKSNAKEFSERFRKLARELPEVAEDALLALAQEAKAEFEITTFTWSNKPDFEIEPSGTGFTIRTDDEIYGYVDQGTRAHTIVPRRAPRLHFFTPYQAKTSPGRIGSGNARYGNN